MISFFFLFCLLSEVKDALHVSIGYLHGDFPPLPGVFWDRMGGEGGRGAVFKLGIYPPVMLHCDFGI